MCLSGDSMVLLGQLLLATLFGGLIGLERDIHGRAAGLRTHILVCAGSALFMIISRIVAESRGPDIIADPGRIAAQVVTGIGFLGAGAIMKEGFNVRGLTTAACLWIAAAIGMTVGMGEYLLSGAATLIALFCLTFLQHIDKLYKRDSYRELAVKVGVDVDTAIIIDAVNKNHIKIIFVDFIKSYETDTKTLKLTLRLFHKGTTDKISQTLVDSLEKLDVPIKEISWIHGKL